MSTETAKQRKEREAAEAAAATSSSGSKPEQEASDPGSEDTQDDSHRPAGAESSNGAGTPTAETAGGSSGGGPDLLAPDTGPAGRDLRTAGEASLAAPADQNRATFGRTEETFAAEQMLRGGVTPAVAYPTALPREEQVENAQAMGAVAMANATGTKDGVASVYPQVGGATNLALTTAEVMAQLDDGAVDGKGRLVGIYLDDIQEEVAQRRREAIEQAGTSPRAAAAADRIRSLASSPVVSNADLAKPRDEQALVDPAKHTSRDGVDPNDPERRDRARVDAETVGKPASAQA